MARSFRTRWGGILDGGDRPIGPAGFFRVAQIEGAFWFLDPDGGRFLSKGVDTVRLDQDQVRGTERVPYAQACLRKYGSHEAWRGAAAQRLLTWGFNTLGAWSDPALTQAGPSPLAAAPVLDLGASFVSSRKAGTHAWLYGAFPDVFDPAFPTHAEKRAFDACASQRDEPCVLGWFSDNELRWGPDWRGPDELLTLFLNAPVGSPGRAAAIGLLRERYADWAGFNHVWKTSARSWEGLAGSSSIDAPFRSEAGASAGHRDQQAAAFDADCEAFAGAAAERYFAAAARAIRAGDPNHLFLGCRFALVPRRSVIAAAGRHVDVVSFNCYDRDPARVMAFYAETGKPCLIGEFSFRSDDSGLPNILGAGPRVPDQAARARAFENYVLAALRSPNLVGYHWFEHADQPAEGRFDGENSNFGIVTIADDPYGEFTRAMTIVNASAEAIHARTAETIESAAAAPA